MGRGDGDSRPATPQLLPIPFPNVNRTPALGYSLLAPGLTSPLPPLASYEGRVGWIELPQTSSPSRARYIDLIFILNIKINVPGQQSRLFDFRTAEEWGNSPTPLPSGRRPFPADG